MDRDRGEAIIGNRLRIIHIMEKKVIRDAHDRPDAQTVLGQLSRWFEDYNENHPHKALRMKSPREFISSYQPAACPA